MANEILESKNKKINQMNIKGSMCLCVFTARQSVVYCREMCLYVWRSNVLQGCVCMVWVVLCVYSTVAGRCVC